MTSIRDFLVSVLGTYTPNTVTVNGEVVALQGIASVDFLYIFTGLILLLCIYAVFRILGGILCKIF